MKKIILAVWLAFIPASANAATIAVSDVEGCDFHLRGEIVDGDADQLEGLGRTYDGVFLCLDSPGGSLAEGKRIFDKIWDGNIKTRILPGEVCESACSLAFLGGSINTGTANIRFQQRFLTPGAKLGFHAPSLNLPNTRVFQSAEVNAAFEVALQAAESLFDIKLTEEHDVQAMTDFLYQRTIGTRPDSMFYISTVGDAVLANVFLSGFPPPKAIAKKEISNICDNAFAAARMDARPNYSTSAEYYSEIRAGDVDDERKTTLVRTSDRYIGKVYNYFSPTKFGALGCYVELPTDFLRSNDDQSWGEYDLDVFFSPYSPGDSSSSDFDGDKSFDKTLGERVSVPEWYVLAPEMKLETAIPAEGSLSIENTIYLDEKAVRLAGYDLYGGDIEGGLIRNVGAAGCWAACKAEMECDAVTHDRWNRICFLKSVAKSRQTLYLLSKADTYVQSSKADTLSANKSVPVQTFTRRDKAFAGSPDSLIASDSLGQCQNECTQRTCLGFNWVERYQRCELFKTPEVYSDRVGSIAGFMVQPAQ